VCSHLGRPEPGDQVNSTTSTVGLLALGDVGNIDQLVILHGADRACE
jgi:hypothetical protein